MSVKSVIESKLDTVENNLGKMLISTEDFVSVVKYHYLTFFDKEENLIWTKAFQKAIEENQYISIPASEKPYYIDDTIIIPSDRHIKAEEGSVICQCPGVKVILLKNNDIKGSRNISITGGRWEESYRERKGYGQSGMYDQKRSRYGVSTCMFFDNIENLIIKDITFAHTAAFSVQCSNIKNGLFENISFKSCYADGLHFNGNVSNLIVRNIRGQVADDLVALNMYDWQDSTACFGPMDTVLCENLELSENSPYKAFRIQPGTYFSDSGEIINCSADNIIIRNVKGIRTFKMYLQTPKYRIGLKPEKGAVATANNIFFENIEIDLKSPIDELPEYMNSDPIRGTFAAFELGADIKNIYFENIDLKIYKDKYPMSYLICAGPKSCVLHAPTEKVEVFDPYLSSTVENIHYKNMRINDTLCADIKNYTKEISFDDINKDGLSTGSGKILNILPFN
ncbi:MAG: hypothetical protein E7388_06270 [Ruminococcaceae bacterium]|nr:hypothetical protein [Oscillospiraceae bacterium]